MSGQLHDCKVIDLRHAYVTARHRPPVAKMQEAISGGQPTSRSIPSAKCRSAWQTMRSTAIYFSPVVPGVVFTSSGAEGLIRPRRFSGVLDCTLVGPGPAVAGLSPSGPEGCTACLELVIGCW